MKKLKRLVLHRETIRRLSSMDAEHVKGLGVGLLTCDAMESGCFSCLDTMTNTCPLGSQ